MLAATAEDDKYEIHRSSTPPTLLLGVQNDSGRGAVLGNGVVEYSGVSNAAGCPDQNCVRRNAEWVMKEARYVIETFGARGPGSDGEKSAQMYFASLMNDLVSTSSNPACGGDGGALSKSGAFVEPFAVHPHAFMGFIPVCMVLSWLAMAAHWYSGCIVLEWVCAHLPLLIVVMELVLYTRFLDQLFPMRVSHNVAACLPEPRPNAKKRGHADAAYEWRWNALHRIFMWIIALLGTVFL
ncbi:hypothetical protein Pelo_2730 [Pelomyxa schiedti]|nr:hypothetical protein Pelo_2730 [Pelomyxa schiedti]